jgi:hypothetical protein
MNKQQALKLIDDHKNAMIDPLEMLQWAWLRVIIFQIPEKEWEAYLEKATEVLSN